MTELRPGRARRDRDEHYVIDLCDEILGHQASRQHTFDWLRGDPGRAGSRRRLPVDAFWEDLALVVEFHEVQHRASVPFFDKPDVMTISGVSRGEQRRIYDERRRVEVPAHGVALVEIGSDQLATRGTRLTREVTADRAVLATMLAPWCASR
ncbi:hypothetical protein [Agrococcus jejuensis]|uniref:hypothetical protein n=1 Tax=Agrococcus jejuensis TaxID=399736 RepID=UPI0011A6FADF|nr:hypothetical protein [Agrococcus jejuensis]